MAATALIRLGKLTGKSQYLAAATGTLEAAATLMRSTPEGVCQLLVAVDLLLGPTRELVVVADTAGDELEQVIHAVRNTYMPREVIAARCLSSSDAYRCELLEELFADKSATAHPHLYACQGYACQAPLQGLEAITTWLAAK